MKKLIKMGIVKKVACLCHRFNRLIDGKGTNDLRVVCFYFIPLFCLAAPVDKLIPGTFIPIFLGGVLFKGILLMIPAMFLFHFVPDASPGSMGQKDLEVEDREFVQITEANGDKLLGVKDDEWFLLWLTWNPHTKKWQHPRGKDPVVYEMEEFKEADVEPISKEEVAMILFSDPYNPNA